MENQLRHIRGTQTLQLIVAVLALHLWQISCADRTRLHRELVDFATTLQLARDIENRPEDIRALVPTVEDPAQTIANAISGQERIVVRAIGPMQEILALNAMPDPRAALQLQWDGLLAQEWELRSIGSPDVAFGEAKEWLDEWRNCRMQLERQINRLRTQLGSRSIAQIKTPVVHVSIVHPSMSYMKLKVVAAVTASVPTRRPQRLACRNDVPNPRFGSVESTDVPEIYTETIYLTNSDAPVQIDRVRFAPQRLDIYPLIKENFAQLGPMTLNEAMDWAEHQYLFAPYAPGMSFSPLQLPFAPVSSRFYHVGITLIVIGFILQIYVSLSLAAALQNSEPENPAGGKTRPVWLLLLSGEAADTIRVLHCVLVPTVSIIFASLAIMVDLFLLTVLVLLMLVFGILVSQQVMDLRNRLATYTHGAGNTGA